MKTRHKTITDAIKLSTGCEICGYKKHPAALTFDHTNPENKYRTKSGKKVHLSDMIKGNRYCLDTILKEVEKCRILCFNCHMEHTYLYQRDDYVLSIPAK
jgi:hypothetical protein